MAALDELVTELDRSYADAQERMSDPAVYNDTARRRRSGGG